MGGNTFTCDCGFVWIKGDNGDHTCSQYYQMQINTLKNKIKKIKESNLNEVIRDLHTSELNFYISHFWDLGFNVKFGDPLNGFKEEKECKTPQEIADFLKESAVKHYPESYIAILHNNDTKGENVR